MLKVIAAVCAGICLASPDLLFAQHPSAQDAEFLSKEVARLRAELAKADNGERHDPLNLRQHPRRRAFHDVEVYAKAVEWILRHREFYSPAYVRQAKQALATGFERVKQLGQEQPSWFTQPGSTVRGYLSKVDGSTQPYALSLPNGVDLKDGKRWPLVVKLHGRAGKMNEVNFISRHDGKPLPKDQTWIQLDVYGRGNNAYRWAGETDVFEAIEDVRRRYRIDNRRITLWGFSMGGAGAWHLGLHHPAKWSSVGPGAGFVDFYKYQKQTKQLPPWQHNTLKIYDAIDYALNAANVPIITYGGEKDAQLVASTSTVEAAKKLDVNIPLLVGEGMGHKFHPERFKEFMAFHAEKSQAGRPAFPGAKQVRFITYTTKYNRCDWLEIAELEKLYEPAVVEGGVDKNFDLSLKTKNVAALKISREIASNAVIDGDRMQLSFAADGLLPEVYYVKSDKGWTTLDYNASRSFEDNPDLIKRNDLQGPIDDAFMQPFLCVRGTGEPWSAEHESWAMWTLNRFQSEFDKWMRGRVPVVKDTDVTEDMIRNRGLILFGDPGSNSVIAKVAKDLPLRWTKGELQIAGKTFDPKEHGLSMIYPNPLNRRKYIVINSGHTFHEKDFIASNAWLFPRLGDVAVISFTKESKGFRESIEWADLFRSDWKLR